MSILPSERDSLLVPNPNDPVPSGRKIVDPNVLVATAERMISRVMVDENPDHRNREMICRWRVSNLLSAVDESLFFNMVSASLDGMKKTILNQQPNGDWHPCDYEVAIRDVDDEAVMLMGVRWTDEMGQEDVQYQNGAPSVNVNVTAKAAPAQSDAATVELLKMLAAGQLSNQDALARLQTLTEATADVEVEEQIQEPKASAKSKNPRGRRKLARQSD
tara:strand:+ start:10062 stop:10715 length:654 start_codon:yes stop_codon:yes gene_type:complete